MNLETARKLKALNEHLVGQRFNDTQIDEVIIYPVSEEVRGQFFGAYLLTPNGNIISRFPDVNYRVGIICEKRWIYSSSIILWTDLESLKNNESLGVVTEIE